MGCAVQKAMQIVDARGEENQLFYLPLQFPACTRQDEHSMMADMTMSWMEEGQCKEEGCTCRTHG